MRLYFYHINYHINAMVLHLNIVRCISYELSPIEIRILSCAVHINQIIKERCICVCVCEISKTYVATCAVEVSVFIGGCSFSNAFDVYFIVYIYRILLYC